MRSRRARPPADEAAAACAAVASFFGMNLENHLEDDARAFRHVIFFTCAGCGAGFVGALAYMSCTGMIVS